jgi:hypothetical protein
MRNVLAAGTLAAASLLMAGAVSRPAEAVPTAKLQMNADSGVTLTGHGGHGGGRGGGMHGHGIGGGGGGGGGKAFRNFSGGGGPRFSGNYIGGSHHHGGGHHHRGFRFYPRFYGYVPYYYSDYYDSYYDDQCAWLRRKARYTGSRYWWNRYRDCRESYY